MGVILLPVKISKNNVNICIMIYFYLFLMNYLKIESNGTKVLSFDFYYANENILFKSLPGPPILETVYLSILLNLMFLKHY